MTNENSLKEIYAKVSEKIDWEEFCKRVNEKKDALGGLCDDSMCARIVVNDLGVDETENGPVTINEIKDVSGNVSFVARVLNVYEPREFNRSDGTIGRVSNLIVGDNTGRIRVSVWDEKVKGIVDGQIRPGVSLNIAGYTKQGMGGVEVHVGNNGVLSLSDEEIKIVSAEKKIGELTTEMNDVSVLGKVIDIGQLRTFLRKDGSEGKVCNVTLGDNTGTIRLSLWDEKADFVQGHIKIGDSLQINNAYTKKNNFSNNIELSIGSMGSVEKTEQKVEYTVKYTKIADIADGMNDVNLTGRILDISDIRTFTRKDGTEGHIGSFILGDETGKIRISVWDDKTAYLDEFDFDETIDVTNAYAKINSFSQEIELNLGNRGNMVHSKKDIEYKEKIDCIKDILPGKTYNVQGRVVGIGEYKEFERDDGTQNAVSSIEIEDETGVMRVSLWGEHAKISEQLQMGMKIRLSDVFSKFGMNEDIELSAGNRTRIKITE